jgi:hypothetical protein
LKIGDGFSFGKICKMTIGMNFATINISSDLVCLYTKYRSVSKISRTGSEPHLGGWRVNAKIKLKIVIKREVNSLAVLLYWLVGLIKKGGIYCGEKIFWVF